MPDEMREVALSTVNQQQPKPMGCFHSMINIECASCWYGHSVRIQAEVDRLQELIQRVQSIHCPVEIEVYAVECADGECDHADECPHITISVCNECDNPDEVDEYTRYGEYPCATIGALNA